MYLMESVEETRRLVEQANAEDTERALLLTGLAPGARVLDAGCGPGVIAQNILRTVGSQGQVTCMDISPERLGETRARLSHQPNVHFVQGDVRDIPLPEATFDYTWSQYVMEYLPERQRALRELVRVTRPGGKVVVSDIDGMGLYNWPVSSELAQAIPLFIEALGRAGLDVYTGRKMFTEFRHAGLKDVRVHLLPRYLFAGAAEAWVLQDWRIRFKALEPVASQVLGGPDRYHAYCEQFLQLLANPDALKYAVLLVTEGRRP